ncbi:glutathione S-transferase family protein [Sphingomonas sp. RIT328]|uniref:glutathione S-transferase family protein n=1 Tax=Sphingomonas sp. RIT328 TaxID=1470591 RepID=UPI0004505846|nr:glutathione S-transferase N-terminal domain-containing protein [Sphingomonas sp. RIT328]EZP52351.1 hypothetical protein BW41_02513 [Sphingomonas sp. RIT328]
MGVDIERVNVDLFKGESHTPEFLELNPHGLSPVMVDGDFVLYESAAINLYFAEKAGSDLAGATTRERYEILQWMFWSGEQWRVFATLTFDERIGKRFSRPGTCSRCRHARTMERRPGAAHWRRGLWRCVRAE